MNIGLSKPERALRPFLRWHEKIVEFLGHCAGWVLGIVAVLICLDIAIRYFGLGALAWVIELSEYFMYGAAFLGAPWVLRQNGHVALDLLTSKLPDGPARKIEILASLFGLLATVAMTVYGFSAVYGAWRDNMVTVKTWSYQEWILLLPIPISGLLMAVEFIRRLLLPTTRDPSHAVQTAIP